MRRVMLLALLALALPTAALASAFDFPVGHLHAASSTISGSITPSGSISVTMNGDENIMSFTTGTLIALSPLACPGATACFSFGTGSSVHLPTQPPFGTTSLVGGFLTRTGNDVSIAAFLAPNSFITSGSFAAEFHFTGTISAPTGLTRGSGGVQGQSTIPEPGTLSLLGTGVIGLAGLTRRKRKLGT